MVPIAKSAAPAGSQGSHHRVLLSVALLEILTDHRCTAERSIVRSTARSAAAGAGGPSESTDRPAAPAKNAQERESCILHFYTFVLLLFCSFAVHASYWPSLHHCSALCCWKVNVRTPNWTSWQVLQPEENEEEKNTLKLDTCQQIFSWRRKPPKEKTILWD